MNLENINKITVIGAGEMGHGIAEVAALAGYDVALYDIEEDILENAMNNVENSLAKLQEKDVIPKEMIGETLDRISTTTDLKEAGKDADFTIEAGPEKLDLKRDIFSDLDEYTPEHAILSSNTSSLPITEIAEAVDRPEKIVGMHWFNPPVLMDLVEVIYGEETSDETAQITYKLTEDFGKTPIYCRKDVRGFIVNNVLGPFMGEPMWMVSRNEAEIREVDAGMVYQCGYPMGPFELSDMTGIDINYHVREEAGDEIPPIMEEKVEKDELGRKKGKGFYDYEEGEGVNYEKGQGEDFDTLRIEALMVNEAARLIQIGAAKPEEVDTGMRLGTGFPEGPCRRADKIGIDKILEKLEELYSEYGEERYKPVDLLKEKVEAGETGEEAGTGFYNYGGKERTFHTIDVEGPDDRGLVNITLSRPSRLNSFNEDMMEEIPVFIDGLDPEEVRCIVLEGEGDRAFSAGADVGMFENLSPHEAGKVNEVFKVLEDFEAPVIAKIDGLALGGGLEIAMSCDFRIASEESKLGQPEINLGIIPGGGGTQRLPRLIGETRAKEMILRGKRIGAETAEEWGLINRAVPQDELDETVEEFVEDMVEGPVAIKIAKKVINEGREMDLDAAMELESKGFGLLFGTEDMKEGVSAFQEDREPEFKGK